MIRKFRIGDVYKNINTGAYDANKNIWNESEEMEISGYQRFDSANEWDFNRPIKDLSKNDEYINEVLSRLLQEQFQKGILRGCGISQESYEWENSEFDFEQSDINNRLPLSTPFVQPIKVSDLSSFHDEFSYKAILMDDGVVLGNLGDFYVNEIDVNSFESVVMKTLRLEPWKEDYLKIEKGTSQKYKINIIRKANGASGDTEDKSITDFEFDSVYRNNNTYPGLYQKLKNENFDDGIGLESLRSILFAKSDNRFLLGHTGSNVSTEYRWNFIVINTEKKKLEVYYMDEGDVLEESQLTEYSRFVGIDTISSDNVSVIYSIPANGSGGFADGLRINAKQNFGFFGKTDNSDTGLLNNATYVFKVNIDNKGTNTYKFTAPISGVITFDVLVGLLNTSKTLVGEERSDTLISNEKLGASFRLIDGDLTCNSLTGGDDSDISLSYGSVIHASATDTPDSFTSATEIYFKLKSSGAIENTPWHDVYSIMTSPDVSGLDNGFANIIPDDWDAIGTITNSDIQEVTNQNSLPVSIGANNTFHTDGVGLLGDLKYKGTFIIRMKTDSVYNLIFVDSPDGLVNKSYEIDANTGSSTFSDINLPSKSGNNITINISSLSDTSGIDFVINCASGDPAAGDEWRISFDSNVDELVDNLNTKLSEKGISYLSFDDILSAPGIDVSLVFNIETVTIVHLDNPFNNKAEFVSSFNNESSLLKSILSYDDRILIYIADTNSPDTLALTNGDGVLSTSSTDPYLFSDLISFSNNGNEKLVIDSKKGFESSLLLNSLDLNGPINNTFLKDNLFINDTTYNQIGFSLESSLNDFAEYNQTTPGSLSVGSWFIEEIINPSVESSIKFYESSSLSNIIGKSEGDVAKELGEDSKWLRWTKQGLDYEFWVET